MYQPVSFSKWITTMLINFSFIFHLILFLNQTQIVLSLNHQKNCGLNLRLSLNADQIKIISKHSSLKKHQKHCDIHLATAEDHLIELEWLNLLDYFQLKSSSSNLNQTILLITKKAHYSMQKSGNLISKNNQMIIRVQKALKPYLDNLSIKVNNLKLIRFEFKQLISFTRPHCVNIYNSIIELDFNLEFKNELDDKLINSNKNYNLSISSPPNQNCVKIKFKTFHSSKLIIIKDLGTCELNRNSILINVIRSTNIELRSLNANFQTSVCLSLIDLSPPNKNQKYLIKKKLKLKRNLKSIDYDDDFKDEQIDNCVSDEENAIRCFVLFENKLDFESADQICKKILLPYKYKDVGLANLNTSFSLSFVKRFMYR